MTTSRIGVRRRVADQQHTVTVRQQPMTFTTTTRNRTMYLLPEALARAQMYEERLREAERDRLVSRISSARRARRRAELAALRARRARRRAELAALRARRALAIAQID
ncbi:hypothetical protein TH66_09970 [Carbonactinospora thermoautotrophica]|uniref:Uncharacterized protein n=3 Tax=Carbonactinospora thermoautotrophica TaxID=1469144 RepID=A0A132N2F9_9ACTN|nr:hypothetical protein [Carbonactinospora thermoautotrophica]KWX04196.1 hypothetical protein TH66_09970 [Carbonactinospora thermoautotrophica]